MLATKRKTLASNIALALAMNVCVVAQPALADEIVPKPNWQLGGNWYDQFHLEGEVQTGFSYHDELAAAYFTQRGFSKSNPAAVRYLSQTGQTLSINAFTIALQPVYQINEKALVFGYITGGMVQELATGNPDASNGPGWARYAQTLPGLASYGGGIGDIYVGGQYRFYDETDQFPALTAVFTGIIPAARFESLGDNRIGGMAELDARKYFNPNTFVIGGLSYERLFGKGTVAASNAVTVSAGVGRLMDQGQWVPSLNLSYTYAGRTQVGNGLSLPSDGSLNLSIRVETPWKGTAIEIGFANLQALSLSRTSFYTGFSYSFF